MASVTLTRTVEKVETKQMIVNLVSTVEETEQVNIEFPLLRKTPSPFADMDPDDAHTVVYQHIGMPQDGESRYPMVSLTQYANGDFEFESHDTTEFKNYGGSRDSLLGQGEYALTSDEWNAAIDRAIVALQAAKV